MGGTNRTYQNQTRVRKEFQIGDIVACRQLQVSTGPNSSLKPRHTGPYAVLQVNKDTLSCIVEDLANGGESKQHFTNLIHVPFNPETQRVHGNFIDKLHDMALDIANDRIQNSSTTQTYPAHTSTIISRLGHTHAGHIAISGPK